MEKIKHSVGRWAAVNWVRCIDGGDIPTEIRGEGVPFGRLIATINFDSKDKELSSKKATANAKMICKAVNNYDALLSALKTIAVYSEKSLSLYADDKNVEWKTLAGFIAEKSKAAIEDAEENQ